MNGSWLYGSFTVLNISILYTYTDLYYVWLTTRTTFPCDTCRLAVSVWVCRQWFPWRTASRWLPAGLPADWATLATAVRTLWAVSSTGPARNRPICTAPGLGAFPPVARRSSPVFLHKNTFFSYYFLVRGKKKYKQKHMYLCLCIIVSFKYIILYLRT